MREDEFRLRWVQEAVQPQRAVQMAVDDLPGGRTLRAMVAMRGAVAEVLLREEEPIPAEVFQPAWSEVAGEGRAREVLDLRPGDVGARVTGLPEPETEIRVLVVETVGIV